MTAVLFLIGFIVLTVAIGIFYAIKAPIGYEDESGFHFGWPDGRMLVKTAIPKRTVAFKIFLHSPWARPIVGLAALFAMLLMISQSALENGRSLMPSNKSRLLEQNELENLKENIESNIVQNEPSRLFPILCQRFSRIE